LDVADGNRPILTLLGGLQEVPGKVMGHDGAMRSHYDDLRADSKLRRLRAAGAQVVRHPSYLGPAMKEVLEARGHGGSKVIDCSGTSTHLSQLQPFGTSQRRGMHTLRRRPAPSAPPPTNSRSYQISASATQSLLEPLIDVPLTASAVDPIFELVIEPRREFYRPCIHIRSRQSPDTAAGLYEGTLLIDLNGGWSETKGRLSALVDGFVAADSETKDRLRASAWALVQLYREREGKRFIAELGPTADQRGVALRATLDFDDWAWNMAGRQEPIHQLERDDGAYTTAEIEAAKHGIVYLP
jgi:hypothetical protein